MNPKARGYAISHFKDLHQSDLLDLTPDFQRNPVWNDQQASYLIDSILNRMPVPELFIRSVTGEDGKTVWEVVDGQQRLRSIIRFFTGDLTLEGSDVTAGWLGWTWRDVPKAQRIAFWGFELVVRQLQDATDDEVRQMFRRLNANQSNLNAQELRHSEYRGRFISVCTELASSTWWIEKKLVNPNQVRRMLDIEFMAELLVGLMAGPLDKKIGLDAYFADYDASFPRERYWKRLFTSTMAEVDSVLDGDLRRWNTKTEFYTLFLAVGFLIRDGVWEVDDSERARIRTRLSKFRSNVDRAKRDPEGAGHRKYATRYAEAARRASTDLSRRETRISLLQTHGLGVPSAQALHTSISDS